MLPHVPNIGISETFGTTTIGSINLNDPNEESIHFNFEFPTLTSNSNSNSINLSFIDNSKRKLWDTKINEKIKQQRNDKQPFDTLLNNQIKKQSAWIPKNNISDLNNRVNDSDFFDPCIGNLCCTFKINKSIYSIFPIGINNNILAIGMIDPKWKKWKKIKNGSEINETRNLKAPKFIAIQSLNLHSEIFQIEAYKLNDVDHQLILIRTSNNVHVLKCMNVKNKISITRIFKFKKDEKWTDFANSSVFVGDSNINLVIIDKIGKFIIFTALISNKIEFNKKKLKFDTIYDPVELSNFKKTIWIDEFRLILITRSQLHEYNLTTGKLFCRICAGTWTKILDLNRSLYDNSIFYLLTSKETILVNTIDNKFRRKLAWKHFYNDIDTSLYLNIIPSFDDLNNELCIISSKQININYVLNFDVKNLKILNNPRLFFSSNNVPNLSMNFYHLNEDSNFYLLLQKNKNLEVSYDLITSQNSYVPQQINIFEDLLNNKLSMSLDLEDSKNLYSSLVDYYKFEDDIQPTAEEITVSIYDELDKFIEEEKRTHISLLQLINNIHIPRNIKNVSKIVDYIITNDKTKELNIKINKNILNIYSDDISTSEDANINTLRNQSNSLLKFFQSMSNDQTMSEVVFYLFLSSIEIWKTPVSLNKESVDQEIESSINELPTDYKNMLDSFEDDFRTIGIYDSQNDENAGFASTDPFMASMSTMPTVSISQAPPTILSSQVIPKTSNYTKSSSVKKSATQPNSQINKFNSQSNSQSFGSMSQKFSQTGFTQSQSGEPKRKKRRTGF
jgi:hypothetical protein